MVRWGIAGTGTIAGVFADAVAQVDDGTVTAVGSRTAQAARGFAERFAVPHAHGSYEAMAEDADVDAIYIATPHAHHLDHASIAVAAGKHVLCEKPMTLSQRHSALLATRAHDRGVFLMEALWTRFLPSYRTIDALVHDGEIGELLSIEASFGFRAPLDPSNRLFSVALGGGALLDVGIYPVHLAHAVLGVPTAVEATARVGSTGVDEHTVVTMTFPDGALAVAQASIRTNLASTARIDGTDGFIELPAFMHCPAHVDLVRSADGERRRIDTPLGEAPFRFEIEEVHRCLDAGLTESAIMPLADSLAIASTLDRARAAIGLSYPDEELDQ
jgi:predicted dehydrogenase